MWMRNLCSLAIFCLPPSIGQAAAAPPDPTNSTANTRMDAILSLRLESIPGDMPTFYSPHAKVRAKHLQRLLGGEITYYANRFHVALRPVAMAVLDAEQWPKVADDEPYGMPSVDGASPPVIVMPVSWNDVRWMVVPQRREVPTAMLREALVDGKTWSQVKFEGCDGIGTHEIGHSIIRQLGIDPQTKWFNEFLASHVGYAYLKAMEPGQALSNEIFWTVGLGHAPHLFTKLDDFETRYDELQRQHPGNYGWYQLALDQRVIEVHGERGVDYLLQIRKEFPTGAAKLGTAQLLERLEKISPGWKAWALRLEAGQVTASKLF